MLSPKEVHQTSIMDKQRSSSCRMTKCTKCGKVKNRPNTAVLVDTTSTSDYLTDSTRSHPATLTDIDLGIYSQNKSDLEKLAAKERKLKENTDYKLTPVSVKHHKKVQVNPKKVKLVSQGVQVEILATIQHKDKLHAQRRENKDGKRKTQKHYKSDTNDVETGGGLKNSKATSKTISSKVTQTALTLEEITENQDAVCCRCTLEVYKRRNEFNAEKEEMKKALEDLKQNHQRQLKLSEQSHKKRRDELTLEMEELLEKRKKLMTPIQLEHLEKEEKLWREHSELNKLENKLLDRMQTLTARQRDIEQAEKDLIETENQIERRNKILSEKQEAATHLSQMQQIEEQQESDSNSTQLSSNSDLARRKAAAEEKWDIVRNVFQNRSEVLVATLNNCKVQLAATENRELELKRQLNECKSTIRELELSSSKKDRKIRDLQDRLTTMIKQSIPSRTTSSKRKPISIDSDPNKNNTDDNSSKIIDLSSSAGRDQFVYFSASQQKQSVSAPTLEEGVSTKAGMNGGPAYAESNIMLRSTLFN